MKTNQDFRRASAKREEADGFSDDAIKRLLERATCRAFQTRDIPGDVLNSLLQASASAPSAGNLQPFSIIKIESDSGRRRLAELCRQEFMAAAPTCLVFCIDYRRLKRWAILERAPFTATDSFRHFWMAFQDTLIAAQSVCVAAEFAGLGSSYVGATLERFPEMKAALELPQGVMPVVAVCLGYPRINSSPSPKLDPAVLVHDETYRDMDDSELRSAYADKHRDQRLDITDERLARIQEVCAHCHGEEYAAKCLAAIRENGDVNAAQCLFGLHYVADGMPESNELFMRQIKELGFGWFEPYHPTGKPPEL